MCHMSTSWRASLSLFFFNDTATTEIYTLSLHDALPILIGWCLTYFINFSGHPAASIPAGMAAGRLDRKSTRLNSSHSQISYAVFCLKKKTIIKHAKAEVLKKQCVTQFDDETRFDVGSL